jgi:hypothetical protein
MPGVSREQVAAAREVDLLTYLREREPQELLRSGYGEYRTKSHGSLVISNGLWFWHRGQVGGRGALDYLIKIRGMGFVEAVEVVSGIRAAPSFSLPPVERSKHERNDRPLFLPPPVRFPKEALAYLQNRGIAADVIRRCMDAGILYEGRYSGEPVCVFVGRDEDGKERFACMRGTHSDLKQDCRGSDKRFSFYLEPAGARSSTLAVFEAPIDAVSHLCLYSNINVHRLSLGGTSDVALMAFLERQPHIGKVVLCLDSDEAGQQAVKRIRLALAERYPQVTVSIEVPTVGTDYNDMLIHIRERDASPRKEAGFSL